MKVLVGNREKREAEWGTHGTSPESSLFQSPQVPSQNCYSSALSPPVHTEPLPTSSHREDRAIHLKPQRP